MFVKARDVAAWASKARGESVAEWIGDRTEHDWNRLRLTCDGDSFSRAPTEKRIRPQIDQLFCQHS
jgi:hypothetical protein